MPRGNNPRCCCRPLTRMFTESFDVIFATAETAAPTLTVGETLESAANVKCNGNVHGYNLLTENEAEEIVAAFQNQDGSKGPKWRDPDELFEKVEEHDGKIECEPYYNKWALYVAMNKAASDQNSVILKWIGDDKDKYLVACYDLALTDLKDKDRPYWIRKYFHVESKF